MKKWEESKDWCYGPTEAPRIDTPSYATKCRRWRKNRPDPAPAKAPKRLASRFYQMKTGHALTASTSDTSAAVRVTPAAAGLEPRKPASTYQVVPRMATTEGAVEGSPEANQERFRMTDHFADERCSKAVLRFLETTGVGKAVPKERPTEEDSNASVVDYASEPEEEAEAQQAWRLAERGRAGRCARGRCACAGCAVGSPGTGRPGRERGEV